MESRDNVQERFAVWAQQMPAMKAQIRTVEGRRRGGRLTWPMAAAIALGLALALPHAVQARTLRCGTGDIGCLIAAINEANTNGQPRNTIRLQAGTYTLTAVDNDTDGPNGLPSVTSTLTIRGAGAETTVIERDASAPAFRLLHVEATGTLTLSALTLQGGNASGPPGPPAGGPGDGGGIFSSGALTVTHSTLRNNAATGGDGPPLFGTGGPGDGGAIFSSGTLIVTHSTLADNTATGGAGGLPAGPGDGGGIFSSGALTVTHSTLSGNRAAGSFNPRGGPGGFGNGGGIFSSGALSVTHSTLSGNTATGAPSANDLSGSGDGGGIFNSGTLTVTTSTLSGNTAAGASHGGLSSGGGIFSSSSGTLTVTNCTLSGNTAMGSGGVPGPGSVAEGGGIFSGGTLIVTHSTLRDNTAAGTRDAPGAGGGIFGGGTIIVMNSTLGGNTATNVGAVGSFAHGGGIFSAGTLTVTNSTLSGNNTAAAGPSSSGGGIFSIGSLTVTVTNSTVSGNVSIHGGGLANDQSGGPVVLQNTVLALNGSTGTDPDCVGAITSLGNNLIGDPTGCTITLQPSDLTGDPGLGAFTDNSRPGNGHFPLLPTSQAIDAGSDTVCPRRDQLGQRRIGPCDIGAIRFRDQDDRGHDKEDDPHEGDPDR